MTDQPDEADVCLAPFKVLDDIVGRVAFYVDVHVWKFATQPLNESWQYPECRGIRGADRNLADLLAGGDPCQRGGCFDRIQNRQRPLVKDRSRLRQLDLPGAAHQQLYSQFLLERAYLQTE